MTTIRTEIAEDEPYATVVISNPERENAVSESDTEELAAAFRELDANDDVRCLVLTGDGDAFCAGADLTSVGSTPTAESIDRGFHAAVEAIMTCSKPVIAKVDGAAIGAGASLATACDFVYADESARIGFSFSNIGLTADTGATFILPRLVGVRTAAELLMSGDILPAPEAEEAGLLTEVVDDGDIDKRVHERATDLANGPTRVHSSLRRLLLRSNANTLEEQLELEAREQERMFYTQDMMEGVAAFTEDRDPDFQGQ
ncbi:enoyl-CoA hydratase-related protein [Halostagnicola sp. A-GB9-2]|uniref:enoyl-CoA hydratase/isomerase family protein n=1 Tax=Halostagnicola sp. A-GB9-2 TaxID=3048066 RepID=UPI0024BF85C9|nr:enoyl-CoA hydratase-related protein [Halostagnicola sp. A-GB9-2]MDJ1432480.1 enoyl-CoA hydratase-related protein [Halostagnicola sp. A-GB9-2]